MKTRIVSVILFFPLVGCGTFYEPVYVKERTLRENSAIITDSNTKTVFAFSDPERRGEKVFCVEPSPDTAAQSARQAQGGLGSSVNVSPPTGQASGSATINVTGSGSNTINVERLLDRTQGIQLTRDVLFNSCLALVNGFISTDQYRAMLVAALQSANTLVSAEVAVEEALSKISPSDGKSQVTALKDFYSFVAYPNSAIPAWLAHEDWDEFLDPHAVYSPPAR